MLPALNTEWTQRPPQAPGYLLDVCLVCHSVTVCVCVCVCAGAYLGGGGGGGVLRVLEHSPQPHAGSQHIIA